MIMKKVIDKLFTNITFHYNEGERDHHTNRTLNILRLRLQFFLKKKKNHFTSSFPRYYRQNYWRGLKLLLICQKHSIWSKCFIFFSRFQGAMYDKDTVFFYGFFGCFFTHTFFSFFWQMMRTRVQKGMRVRKKKIMNHKSLSCVCFGNKLLVA